MKVYAHTIQVVVAFQKTKGIRHCYQRFELCTIQSIAMFFPTGNWLAIFWVDVFDFQEHRNNKQMVLKTLKLKTESITDLKLIAG